MRSNGFFIEGLQTNTEMIHVPTIFPGCCTTHSSYLAVHGDDIDQGIAGATDVDAIALSLARFHQEGMASGIASTGITVAALTNPVVKPGIAFWLGKWTLAARIFPGMGFTVGAGALALLFL